jgi:light-regulated signal transduction histidine kinase (bacteriophytochrome)/DNA-binding response OmpR family regulator
MMLHWGRQSSVQHHEQHRFALTVPNLNLETLNLLAMNSPNFITSSESVNLTSCDHEPIHIPGRIQPHGVLLVLQEPQLTILQVSLNINQWFDISPESLPGQSLECLFGNAQVEKIKEYLAQKNLEVCNPFELRTQVQRPAVGQQERRSLKFKGSLHRTSSVVVLELEPYRPTESKTPEKFYQLLRGAMSSICNADNLADLVQILAKEARKLTGFDRILVYRFAADFSGVVLGEDKQNHLESYLGLHYPAIDMPPQARKLLYENCLRIIPTVNYQPANLIPINNPLTDLPLDLSTSVFRAVSPCHLEYLRNMGVIASMSTSLMNEKQLWGLIACHHYSPKYIDYETRKAFEFLGRFASVEVVYQHEREMSLYREQVKLIQDELRQALAVESDLIGQILQRNQSKLLNLVHAQGAALVLDDQLTLIGQTPSELEIQALISWLLQQNFPPVFSTNSLPELYPNAQGFKECASGILSISIFLNHSKETSYHILWFRSEQVQLVNWAGDPNESVLVTVDGNTRLTPRKSFELWRETVRGKSFPWQPLELEAAQEMKNTLMLAALEFSQVALEQAVAQAEAANRAKSQFFAKMSHELRTPLHAILGFTQLMSRDRSIPKEHQEHLDIVNRNGEHLLNLINDVLDISKIEAGQITLNESWFDLHRLVASIQDAFTLKASDKRLELLVKQDSDMPSYVYGDEGKLRQILMNLVGNAVKFTASGHVMVQVRVFPPAYTFHFEVEDTGPGIATEELESIFETFVQTEQGRRFTQGAGLGLCISRQFAHLMGGDIVVQSTLGRGTTFTCKVPLAIANAVDILPTMTARRVIGLEPGQPHYRILIAEDIVENRQLLLKLLEAVGFEVRVAENGLAAIALWSDWKPHLILMDIEMPVMNGHEATQQIRATIAGKDAIIIALTANAFEEDREAALRAGCNDYIAKPFAESTLFNKLGYYLDLRYIYIEEIQLETSGLSTQSTHLTAQDLQVMPTDWIANIRAAALVVDDARVYELLDQIPGENCQLADALRSLVDNFRLETIVELTNS